MAVLVAATVFIAACTGSSTLDIEGSDEPAGSDNAATDQAPTAVPDPTAVPQTAEATAEPDPVDANDDSAESDLVDASDDSESSARVSAPQNCADIAELFVAGPATNPELAEPAVAGTCSGDILTVRSNGIPSYTYVETSPGAPRAQDYAFAIPTSPVADEAVTAIPRLGPAGVTLGGIPIYGPTEGTGGDVASLDGALSECGSHNGPTGFHMHLVGTSDSTDCIFTPTEVAAEPQLLGYAFDGYPIYTGNDQFSSSWELSDPSLFATDTWAAHSFVKDLGDLDACNGRTDEAGRYAYYTTDSFPYVLGCFRGVVDLAALAGIDERQGDDAAATDDESDEPEESTEADPVPSAEDLQTDGDDSTTEPDTSTTDPTPTPVPDNSTTAEPTPVPDNSTTTTNPTPVPDNSTTTTESTTGDPLMDELISAAAALGITVDEISGSLFGPPFDLNNTAVALNVDPDELLALMPLHAAQ